MSFMILLHDLELAKWEKHPMVQGKFYQSLCVRELIDGNDLLLFYDLDHEFDYPLIQKNSYVIYLDSVVIEFYNEYGMLKQTFIKVLSEQGYCGWAIWFSDEWKKVKKCP